MRGQLEVHRSKVRLQNSFERFSAHNDSPEVQSDLAKYLCVLTSGFFEKALIALILDFADQRSSPEVVAYVESSLRKWTNPNVEKICQLVGSFNSNFKQEAQSFLIDERKESVNSLVALRHKIVHGGSVGVTMSQVIGHRDNIFEVVDFVDELLSR